jgi:ribosome-associated toxin RatA of RatAB toxin-antitoxin module
MRGIGHAVCSWQSESTCPRRRRSDGPAVAHQSLGSRAERKARARGVQSPSGKATMSRAGIRLSDALRFPRSVATTAKLERVRKQYSVRQWEALTGGEILSAASRGDDGHHAAAAGVIDCPPRELWPLMVDFESRPDYLPGAQQIRIERVTGNRVWLAETVKFLFVRIAYRVINTLDPAAGMVRWVLDETAANDIVATAGAWDLVSLDGGRRTLLRYANVLDTGQPIPAAVERLLLTRSLPEMIAGMRREAKRRRGDRSD